jgi:hypothetical protein
MAALIRRAQPGDVPRMVELSEQKRIEHLKALAADDGAARHRRILKS